MTAIIEPASEVFRLPSDSDELAKFRAIIIEAVERREAGEEYSPDPAQLAAVNRSLDDFHHACDRAAKRSKMVDVLLSNPLNGARLILPATADHHLAQHREQVRQRTISVEGSIETAQAGIRAAQKAAERLQHGRAIVTALQSGSRVFSRSNAWLLESHVRRNGDQIRSVDFEALEEELSKLAEVAGAEDQHLEALAKARQHRAELGQEMDRYGDLMFDWRSFAL